MEFLLAQSGTFDATNLIAAVITAGITIAIWVGNRTGRRAQLELEEKRLGLIASLKQLAADSPNEATKIRVSKAADDVLLQVCEALVVESDASHTPEVATRVTERIPLHRKLLSLIHI